MPLTVSRTLSLAAGLMLAVAATSTPASAQSRSSERSPMEVYRGACAACHGPDGRGLPQTVVGFDLPLPDFTDCSFATREPDGDWFAIAHDGGPARAFDRRMPAFGEALTRGEIEQSIEHIRGFCADRAWPRGELNLPRPLVTEKAFPEDEAVLTATIDTAAAGAITQRFLYEKRLGARTQYEVAVPFVVRQSAAGSWERGLGDAAVALKHVLAHSLARGSIVSLATEIVLPTGKESQGLGKGVTIVEPFVAAGQILPHGFFLHAQAGGEVPANRARAAPEALWRTAVGRTFEQAQFGRAWSPMIEILGARELEAGARAQWDVVPQMQVTLSRRQHIMLNGGVRVPLTERGSRRPQVITYLLWDWFDGGFTEGWR